MERFHLETWRYAVPVMFGPPPPLKPGQHLHTATCTVVEHGEHRYAISAAHVLVEAWCAVRSGAPTDVVIGPLNIDLNKVAVSYVDVVDLEAQPEGRSYPIDLATLRLTEQQVKRLERDGYRVIRPPDWPPPTVRENDSIFMAGYPAALRHQVSVTEHDFGATTFGLIVQSVHDSEFIAHRDPAFSETVRLTLDDVPPQMVGGCSGGPVFLVRDEPVLIPRLCGVVKEGWSPFGTEDLLLRFARLDVTLNADGAVRSP